MQSKIVELICCLFNILFFQAVSNDSRLDSMFTTTTSISTSNARSGQHMLSSLKSTIHDDDKLLGARVKKKVDHCSATSTLFRRISFPDSSSECSCLLHD